MNKFWVVLFHTYLQRLKSKSFLITTAITIALIYGLVNLPTIMDYFDKDKIEKVAVIDKSNVLFAPLQKQIEQMNGTIDLEHYEGTEDSARTQVMEGELDSYLILKTNSKGFPEATYKAKTVAEQRVPADLEQALQQIKGGIAAEQLGLSEAQIAEVYSPVDFNKVALEEGAKTEDELNQARVFVYILLFVIYFSVLFYGNMIAVEVATEKASRVMEILISSVSPVKQMFGKILGVALLGLTQYFLILLSGFLFLRGSGSTTINEGLVSFLDFSNLSLELIGYAVIFFLLGYLLYATLLAMVGSLVSRVEEVQQMIMPVQLFIIAAFFIAMYGLSNPEAGIVTAASYFPLFTPIVMFLRIGMINIPWWEAGLGILLLIGSIVVCALVGAKVYRGGVLMYGKSTSLKDFKRALTLAKKES
ncbi:ABC transporter permease [Pseudalkalibacillus caeni]|uniref:ABC transporter permease n=1 Tax=Exobacillus caeni TaxID=2574798 RepID=A0A5R9F2Y5_9BACL|nr:ABC transporter permease [Pseudalkalibacillus caeni]TLS38042.1 ABC transporter permease [Pseudalkalibacillus caeni]